MSRKPIVLVDQDGVLADWETTQNETLAAINPDHPMIQEERLSYNLMTGDPLLDLQTIQAMNTPGVYQRLAPMPGIRNAMDAMLASGLDVFICSSPWVGNPTCASDKMKWVEEHLGEEWVRRTILTQDKTLVRGRILIDDKPEIHGALTPTWQQVIFDQPYNRMVTDKPRIFEWNDGVVDAIRYLLTECPRDSFKNKKELVSA